MLIKKLRFLAYSVEPFGKLRRLRRRALSEVEVRIAYSRKLNAIRYPCLSGRQALNAKAFCFLVSYILILGFLCGCRNKTLHRDTQVMMGTFIEVISPNRDAANIVFTEIRRIDNLLSKYREDAEVAKLNKSGKLQVSRDTFYILRKSEEFWRLTDGAFDITVAPLLDIWGFTDKKYRVPTKEEIEKAITLVGSDKIIFNLDDNVVKFKLSGMKIDLGAIAKGYAVDCSVKKLKEYGIKSCLINAGGQIYCLGDKSGKPWRVAIRNPRKEKLWDYLELENKAVSTSGDYEQYFIKKEKRYSHILNPKTGYPAGSGIISVTVIADSGLIADALSTSIFVLGKEKGLQLVKKFLDVKVEIIEEKDVSLGALAPG